MLYKRRLGVVVIDIVSSAQGLLRLSDQAGYPTELSQLRPLPRIIFQGFLSVLSALGGSDCTPYTIRNSSGLPLLPILTGRPMLLMYSLSGSMPSFVYRVAARSATWTGLSFTNPPFSSVEP